MEAPDKIYLCADAPRVYDWSRVPFEKGGNIKYIRKNALLEWAEERKEQLKKEAAGCSNMLAAGEYLAYDKLIEQIESMQYDTMYKTEQL